MKTKADRDINKLNPLFKGRVEQFLKEVNKNGNIIFITEGFRNQERQNELYKLGLSQIKHSNHQDGFAIDIGFYGNELYPNDFSKWRSVADIAKKYNINWGYDLRKRDKPHFELGTIKNILVIDKSKMSKYTEIMQTIIKETGFDTIFDKQEGNNTLTEQEIKELIEIAFARFAKRNNLI